MQYRGGSGVSRNRIVLKSGQNGVLGGKKRRQKNEFACELYQFQGGGSKIGVRGGGGRVPPFTPPNTPLGGVLGFSYFPSPTCTPSRNGRSGPYTVDNFYYCQSIIIGGMTCVLLLATNCKAVSSLLFSLDSTLPISVSRFKEGGQGATCRGGGQHARRRGGRQHVGEGGKQYAGGREGGVIGLPPSPFIP